MGVFHARRHRDEQEAVLRAFSSQASGGCVLVCTDALARGIDTKRTVDLVVQLVPAENGGVHLHRVGRTARQGQSGVAVTIACSASESDAKRVAAAKRAVLAEEEDGEAGSAKVAAARPLDRRRKRRRHKQ